MARPNSRQDFIDYCLRRLGSPVINVNVSPDQAEDRVDDAVSFWWDYHFEGNEKVLFTYQITANDIAKGTSGANVDIALPDNIIGTVDIFDLDTSLLGGGIFNAQYQFVLQNVWNWQSVSLIPYFMAYQNLQFIEMILVGKQPIRYSRYRQVVNVDMDWSRLVAGQFLIFRCYQAIDPDVYTKAWGDRLLQQLATARIKQQWGTNLGKYGEVKLPNGMVFNGERIYREAVEEIEKTEKQIWDSSLPADMMIG